MKEWFLLPCSEFLERAFDLEGDDDIAGRGFVFGRVESAKVFCLLDNIFYNTKGITFLFCFAIAPFYVVLPLLFSAIFLASYLLLVCYFSLRLICNCWLCFWIARKTWRRGRCSCSWCAGKRKSGTDTDTPVVLVASTTASTQRRTRLCFISRAFIPPNIQREDSMNLSSPFHIRIFIDDNIFETIAKLTISNGNQQGITINASKVEIHFYTGITPMPQCCVFWAQETRFPSVADIISRDMFQYLLGYFHN